MAVERLETKQLLSFDPRSMIPASVQPFAAAEGQGLSSKSPLSTTTTQASQPQDGPVVRPSTGIDGLRDAGRPGNIGPNHVSSFDTAGGIFAIGNDGSGGGSGTGPAPDSGYGSGPSGSRESGDSGPDGNGGTYTVDQIYTWDDTQTSNSDGSSSYTNATTNTTTYSDSGTTSDGVNYTETYNDNSHSNGSGYTLSDGTTHTENSSGDDANYTDHADDGLGGTYDDGGTYTSTGQGHSDGGSNGTFSVSSSDSNGEDHYTAHGQAGPSTDDESGSDYVKDHYDGTLNLLNYYTLISDTSNNTHDFGGTDTAKTHLDDGAGDTTDGGYFDEGKGHAETHTTFDGSTWSGTYAASANSSDDGKENQDIVLSDGSTSGSEDHYADQSQSGTDPTAGSTGSYSHDDGGSDYATTSITDAHGSTLGGNFSDQYTNHDQGNTNPDGTSTSSWTAGGSGHDTSYLNIVGVNTLNATGHDEDSYTASGGTNADGTTYETDTSEIDGGDNFTIHVQDNQGDSLDENGSDSYQAQETNGVDTGSSGGSVTYTITNADGTSTGGTISYGGSTPSDAPDSMPAQGLAPDQGQRESAAPQQQQAPQQGGGAPAPVRRPKGGYTAGFGGTGNPYNVAPQFGGRARDSRAPVNYNASSRNTAAQLQNRFGTTYDQNGNFSLTYPVGGPYIYHYTYPTPPQPRAPR